MSDDLPNELNEGDFDSFRQLFVGKSTMDRLRNQLATLTTEINNLPDEKLRDAKLNELAEKLLESFNFRFPTIARETISTKNIKRVGNSAGYYHGSPPVRWCVIASAEFAGDPSAFSWQPSTGTKKVLTAWVLPKKIRFALESEGKTSAKMQEEIKAFFDGVDEYLQKLTQDNNSGLDRLRERAIQMLPARIEEATKRHQTLIEIGFPIARKESSQLTYVDHTIRKREVTPEVRNRIAPVPVLSEENYQHILKVIENMAWVIQSAPQAFVSLEEEHLRFHFLIQLNGHFESATGETFHGQGKTDIHITSRLGAHEERDVFVAECKFWKGPAGYSSTIDQLFLYQTWRDTKAAVIVFSKTLKPTELKLKMHEVTIAHPNFKSDQGEITKHSHRYIFKHPSDAGIDLFLTTMMFYIQTK